MSRAVRLLWSWPFYTFFVMLTLMPIVGNSLPRIDGWLFPVTTKIAPTEITRNDDGSINFRFSYIKLRACEILGVEMRDLRGSVDFIKSGDALGTRSVGAQTSSIFRIVPSRARIERDADGVDHLVGLDVFFLHRCNPIWLTQTQVYP